MAQLGYAGITTAGAFTFTSVFDCNDGTNSFLLHNPDFGAPGFRTAFLDSFSVPGGVLSTYQYGLRVITIPIRLSHSSADNLLSKYSALVSAMNPANFLPHGTTGTIYLPFLKWQPTGVTDAKYYSYGASSPPPLLDGRDLGMQKAFALFAVDMIPVSLTCQPFAYGAAQAL